MTRLARLIALAILICVFTTISRGAAPATKADSSAPPTVAIFEFNTPVAEASSSDLALFGPPPQTLRNLVRRINDAARDENVKAIVIMAENLEAGLGQIEEIRQAIEHVRAKGKEVFVHSDSMRMREYVLFSGASRISVVPTADIWVNGIHADQPYLRGLLDKIGVKPDFEHIGPYKSASELFMRQGPSEEADAMMNWLLDSIYNNCIDEIATGRKVPAEKAKQWIDAGPYTAEQAKQAGLIDAIEQRQDFDAMLKKKFGDNLVYERRYGVEDRAKIDFSSPFAFVKIWADLLGANKKEKSDKPSVGIVFVDGMIMSGSAHGSLFDGGAARSSDIRKALDEAARDDQIKAVVLRIDSPGGSAVASEIILDATRRVKAKKPLIVSMGNVAGSGGYYVACAADTVFADRSTITASIGVVGGKLVTTGMWNKIGITFKSYDRGANAAILSTDAPFTESQRAWMQKWMQEVYGTFKQHVLDARKDKLKKPIEEIAQGRVFTGQQALELGLVDKIGTLQDAIESAAERANLKEFDYDVRVVPEPKNFLEKLMEESNGSEGDNKWVAIAQELPIRGNSLFNLALPYLQNLDLSRVNAIHHALDGLQLLGNEGVLMLTTDPPTIR